MQVIINDTLTVDATSVVNTSFYESPGREELLINVNLAPVEVIAEIRSALNHFYGADCAIRVIDEETETDLEYTGFTLSNMSDTIERTGRMIAIFFYKAIE